MTSLLNLSTRGKLTLGFGFMVALLLLVAYTGYNTISHLKGSQTTLLKVDLQNALDLERLESDQNAVRAAMLTMMTVTNRAEQQKWRAVQQGHSKAITDTYEGLVARNRDNPRFMTPIQNWKELRDGYAQAREREIIPLIEKGNMARAGEMLLNEQQDRYVQMSAVVRKMSSEAQQHAAVAVNDSEKKARDSIRLFLIVGLIAAIFGFVTVSFLNNLIAKPLRELSDVAARIAEGDISINVASNGRSDEVGILKQNFARMTSSLRTTADVARQIAAGDLRVAVKPQSEKDVLGNSFAQMVENLKRTTAELSEGVNVLASSASEILASTTQVAAGASETATAIAETTTTVEQVKQTAQVSSDKAKYVSDTAHKVTSVAARGRTAVEATSLGINRIQSQMASIAESIVKLSEQSQAIGDIVATVSDLAEQSNLLAVNAAIEAAKAGEHGKGFGVVAQEVRSLAEQSKQATAQIRGILNEIQKATSAAVMTTEQGSKAVESGVRETAEAGETIRVLADSITEAAQAAAQIAASSQQQLVGMDQVALAMENIKQASNQNVSGTRQSESAAHSLHELGQRMKRLVEQYKV